LPVRPATSTPHVATDIPTSIALSVRIFRAAHDNGTISRMIRPAFRFSKICCGTCLIPRSPYSHHASNGTRSAMDWLFTQSVMKFGCRSQSWYIISQKHDMIISQMISRISNMFAIVRLSTAQGDSVLSAPEGTSLNVSSRNRLHAVKPAHR
jgi:hypothetical protein